MVAAVSRLLAQSRLLTLNIKMKVRALALIGASFFILFVTWRFFAAHYVEERSIEDIKAAEAKSVVVNSQIYLIGIRQMSKSDYDRIVSQPFKYRDLIFAYEKLSGIDTDSSVSRKLFEYEITVNPKGDCVITGFPP